MISNMAVNEISFLVFEMRDDHFGLAALLVMTHLLG
jgi:hypothetical protein